MTEGTSSLGPKTGGTAPPKPTQETCEKLDSETDSGRETLGTKTTDKDLVGEDGDCVGTTVSACQVISSENPSTMVAHNNNKAWQKCPDVFEKGGEPAVREGRESGLCNHTHPGPAMQKSGHAEARMLDKLGTGPMPKQLTFSIDWIRATGPSKMPCATCHAYLCQVAKECEVEIYLCDKEKQPHELPCPPTTRTRRALKKLID